MEAGIRLSQEKEYANKHDASQAVCEVLVQDTAGTKSGLADETESLVLVFKVSFPARYSALTIKPLLVAARMVGEVEISPHLRDFQARWKSPAFGLFLGAASSTDRSTIFA